MGKFKPFSEQELLLPGGLYYGVNDPSQNAIDTSKLLKAELARNLSKPGTFLRIDIEGEYNALIEALDGEVVTP